MENKGKGQKKKFKLRWWHILVVIALVTAVWWCGNYTIYTNNTAYMHKNVSSRFRIAVISDLHVHENGVSGENVLRRISSADPDLVFVLGDMYTTGSAQAETDMAVKAISDIAAEGYPTYFVSGEHDNDASFTASLEAKGVNVMNYKSSIIDVKGNSVQIVGIDNVYYSSTFDLRNEFVPDRSCFSILLAHIPNYDAFAKFGADLTLCADTHGYMAQLPFGLGPVFDPDSNSWFPKLTSDTTVFDKGWFQYPGGAMFITSGLGDSPYPIRFNNRPEVVVMDILPEKEGS